MDPTPAEVLEFTNKWVEEYLPNAGESITQNAHMNLLEKEVPFNKIAETIRQFACAYQTNWQKLPGVRRIDLLNFLTEIAKGMSLAGEEERAVVVDFINFVGIKLLVDYALYTRDLVNENWRKDT